ncbi:MAG: tetratricopeptide repeat protein [Thermodesulfobacteriota bacterium]|nr:tetratricopeptide repeat protein [Thermodesulfobacteriota bacterium]
MKHFPFDLSDKDLTREDFSRLGSSFFRTVSLFLPCKRVFYILLDQDDAVPKEWDAGIRAVKEKGLPMADGGAKVIYLPLFKGEDLFGTAVVESDSSDGFPEYPVNWLLDRSRIISREFHLINLWSTDPATGLLNSRHLREELNWLLFRPQMSGSEKPDETLNKPYDITDFSLGIIELYPRSNNPESAISYVSRAGAFLKSLVGQATPLYYLGAGIFALIWENTNIDKALKIGDTVLRWLRHENFYRAHIGITSENPGQDSEGRLPADSADMTSDRLLDEAWKALRTARKRGPYALCSYVSVSDLENHPLKPTPEPILKKLKHLGHGKTSFAVILIQSDKESKEEYLIERITSLSGDEIPVLSVDRKEVYVFLAGADETSALAWAETILDKAGRGTNNFDNGLGASFSMGIAVYPYPGFRKSDVPVNSRKALLHTRFYGPGTVTAFDGVISLNISGDVYYNEGDLARAVKEYQKGLALDSANVNLLNSLGVSYAHMDRYRDAIPCFENALKIDGSDFMALFNLGLAYLTHHENDEAIGYFELAMSIDDGSADLMLLLGWLYCRTGRYDDAVRLLKRVEEAGRGGEGDMGHGAVHCYLGEAYMALGRNRKAIAGLQRAVGHNSRDAKALSLLGELYLLENEGDDIALSLCLEAVKLDASQADYWYRLGKVQFQQNDCPAAVESLKESLKIDRGNVETMFMLGQVYEKLMQKGRARTIYKKILKLESAHEQADRALKRIS